MANLKEEKDTSFKKVPDSIEGFTPEWCEVALKRGGLIDSSITVSHVDVKRLVDENSGVKDGGGMTSAQMLRITLSYEGDVDNYTLPKTIIAKYLGSGKCMFNMTFPFRLLILCLLGRHSEEKMWRTDISFYENAIPIIKDVYCHPKVYYTGIIDGGNRSFFNEIFRVAPHKIRTVALMQDMNGWKSQMVGVNRNNNEETISILRNVAVLHANFWGDKNKEIREKFEPCIPEREVRGATHSKMSARKRNKFISTESSIRKSTKKMLKNWSDHKWFTLSKNEPLPSWMHSNGEENEESIFVLKDPNVLEMFEAYFKRFPNFSREVSKQFLEKPSQTLLHGDFHNGNHMYKEDSDGRVKVVAFDFQMVGEGVAVADIIRLFVTSRRHISLSDDLEMLEEYHKALVLAGVENFSFEDLKKDFILGYLENFTKTIADHVDFNPPKLTKLYKSMFGEEKWEDLKKIMESGVFCTFFVFLTSLYLHDKDKFLEVGTFLNNI